MILRRMIRKPHVVQVLGRCIGAPDDERAALNRFSRRYDFAKGSRLYRYINSRILN